MSNFIHTDIVINPAEQRPRNRDFVAGYHAGASRDSIPARASVQNILGVGTRSAPIMYNDESK